MRILRPSQMPDAAGGRRRRAAWWLLVLVLGPAAHADLIAVQLDAENFARHSIGGPDAIGGVGDWYLANDVVEIVVDAPERRHGKLNHGGTIVDAGRRDRRDEDQFARLIPIVNFSQRVFLDYDAIRAEVDGAGARLVVSSEQVRSLPRGGAFKRWLDPVVPRESRLAAVRVETVYEVRPGEPFVRIRTTFENTGDADAPLFAFGEFWMRGLRSLRVFTGQTIEDRRSAGFHHRAFHHLDPSSALPALTTSSFAVTPGVDGFPPITYAMVSPERSARGIPFVGLTADHINVQLGLVGDPSVSGRGLWALARALVGGELEAGERWSYERFLVVAPDAHVASATDVLFPLLGLADGSSRLVGRVAPAGTPVGILVERDDGVPITYAGAATEGPERGSYAAVVPPGRYRLTLRAPQRRPRVVEVEVPEGGEGRVPDQVFEAPGALRFEPGFADGGPGRVIVRGVGDTEDPVFGDDLLDYRLDDQRAASGIETDTLYFAGLPSDPLRVELPPGRYALTAVRGLHHDAVRREIEVPGPGAEVRVEPFALAPVVARDGLLAADFHVHSQSSDDSSTPHEQRLRQFAAEAIDVLVASDHNNVPDYAPALARLGLDGRLRVITGVEVTSSAPSRWAPWSIGHHNAWPIARQPLAHRRGAPPSQREAQPGLYRALRERGVEVVQLNHARGPVAQDAGQLFSHLASEGEPFDPDRPIYASPNNALLAAGSDGTRAIDFDAMEVLNGDDWKGWLELRRDWYALLRQGFRRTGTANSDSHGPDQIAGYPRNFLRRAPGESFSQLVRRGRLFGSNGPLVVRFAVQGAGSGALVAAEAGRVPVDYEVVAAPWVPLDEVRLIVDGEVVRRLPLPAGRLELVLTRDAFVGLEAGAPLRVSREGWTADHPGLYTEVIAPGHVPVAFVNPVFVDVDGNGRFDPPGLEPAPVRVRVRE